jgi:hypothetical protein
MRARRHVLAAFSASVLWALAAPVARGAAFVRGDVNADTSVDVSDAVSLLGCLFLAESLPECPDAADANDDGRLDVSDAVYALLYLFLGHHPPAAPFPGCGDDATPDGLGCDAFSPCPPGSEANEVVSIRTVNSGVEIELFSTEPFPARALFPILCAGAHEFWTSRSGADGSLNTLIFSLTAEEFAATRTGDRLSVQYGYCEPDYDQRTLYWDLWVFGVLDKSLLDRERAPQR